MSREPVLELLNSYNQTWVKGHFEYEEFSPGREQAKVERFVTFTKENDRCFERHALPGHYTGSALVVSEDLTQVLLTLHRKLNIWLQLGGHAEGEHLLPEVAMREAQEESGLNNLRFLNYESLLNEDKLTRPDEIVSPLPFDIDHHYIPSRKDEPNHYHYDVRFLVVADRSESIKVSDESHDLKWFSLDEAREKTSEESMLRQFAKVDHLRQRLLTI